MMVHEPLFLPILVGVFLAAPFVARSALSATAPYGRHETEEPVASLPVRLAWIFMESPTVCAFAYFFFRGPNSYQPVPVFLLALWGLALRLPHTGLPVAHAGRRPSNDAGQGGRLRV